MVGWVISLISNKDRGYEAVLVGARDSVVRCLQCAHGSGWNVE